MSNDISDSTMSCVIRRLVIERRHKNLRKRFFRRKLSLVSTWSPAPTSSSARFMWTPFAMSGDCCSIATSRFNVRWSNPTPFVCQIIQEFTRKMFISREIVECTAKALVSLEDLGTSRDWKLTFGGIVITDVLDGVTDDFLVIHIRFRCDFAAQQDHSGLADSF